MNDTKEERSEDVADEEVTILARNREASPNRSQIAAGTAVERRRMIVTTHVLLPLIFLTVALLGGLRLAAADSSFIFLPPPLFCLIFAAVLIVLFARAGILRLHAWFSHSYSVFRNAENGWLLFTLFAASAQLFNSLLPEQGLPFWVVGFCFFWTLWNNLFAEFDPKRLVRSLGALFGLAFVVKYLVLANLTAPESGNWLSRLIENPGKEAFTWLFDLPRFSAGTGYIQFFTAALYFVGLLLLPSDANETDLSAASK